MKFKRVYDTTMRYVTHYEAENGLIIKSNAGLGMFTGRMMQPDHWYIYKSDDMEHWIDGAPTLRECKAIVENM